MERTDFTHGAASTTQRPPVFIVGEARSGSSLLYRLLLEQRDFASRALTLQETHLLSHLPKAYGFYRRSPQHLYKYMLESDEDYGAFLRATFLRRMMSVPLAPIHLLFGKGFGTWRWDGSPSVIRNYFYWAQRARGCRRILEKTTEHVFGLPTLHRAFPDATMLYIHRHPVDVYSSYVRRATVDPKAAKWAALRVDQFCHQYRGSVEAISTFARTAGSRCELVSYEALVADPVSLLRELCRKLGVDYAPPSTPTVTYGGREWAPDPKLFGDVDPQTKVWKDYIDQSTATLIEDTLVDVMRRFSYRSKVADLASESL